MTHRTALFLPLLLLAGCTSEPDLVLDRPVPNSPLPAASSISSASSEDQTETGAVVEQAEAETPGHIRPESVRIDMAFAPQAPHGNWDPPYDEACEEASLIIVHHYLEGTPLSADIMDRDILNMVMHEESVGLPIDINMHQLAQVARDVYGYDAEVIEDDGVTIERIEQELAQGNPVIVPLAGQDIGNPNYTGAGPPYHVLVILGYNRNNFITHDVGTRKGENYTYRKQVIMDAIHDWNGSVDTIRSGPRRILVVTKSGDER